MFIDDTILNIENSKDPHQILELIYKFNNVAGYKSTHKNQFYFYILAVNNLKRKKISNFTIVALKIMKYLGIILTKKVKDLYNENCNIAENHEKKT